jgi:predicted nucleic acid-binding protein
VAKNRKKNSQSTNDVVATEIAAYWQTQIAWLGRNLVFVDSGAILEAHTRGDTRYAQFFQTATDKFVTSSFVITETVRRLIKSGDYVFRGPSGQQHIDLAVHFIRAWLADNHVTILHIPPSVFDLASKTFEGKRSIGCDLNDIISYIIVRGLEQNRIASKDRHFNALGLTVLPGA